MAQEADNQYEASDESSENELLDRSLSVWKGWNWNVKDVFDPIPLDLHTASSIGQYDVVRSYIARKVDLNKKNVGGWSPLMYACYIGHDNIVNLLLDAGVSVNVKNHKGQTPLMLASSCGNESVGYFLVQQGAELEARDHKGWTALFHATYAGHQNMVKFLLEQGANINAVEPSLGLTPFMEAAAEGHEIIVQLFLQHGVNVFNKAHNGDTARSLALIHSNMKIVSLIDNHVMPNTCLRSEAGLDAGELSSSDEAYSKPKQGHRGQKGKGRPSIRDGPDAIARLINRSPTSDNYKTPTKSPKVPKGYVTFPKGEVGAEGNSKLCYRDVTSPINLQDYNALDSSGGRNTDSNDNEPGEDGNAFSKTGALTIKSSSGSSGGLMAAFGLSHSSNDSDDCQPQDSISSSFDGSTGGRDLSDNEATLSPASSYNKAMAQLSIKNQSGVSSESELENITKNEKDIKSNKKEPVSNNSSPQPKSSAMSPTSQLKDREKQSNKSRSNSPSVKFNTQDVIMQQSVPVHNPPPQHQMDQHRPQSAKQPPHPTTQPTTTLPTTQIPHHLQGAKPKVAPPVYSNLAANFMPQLGCQIFPSPGMPDPQFFAQKKPDLGDHPRDLPSLLHQLGLSKYLKVFEEQDVDLQVFLSLTDNDLKEIGIKLFGPRKKMTNAIARWQSKAPMPTNDRLEQAYADRLEGEMQEMAFQLIKATEQKDNMKAEIKQEQQLRLVTESCLNDERAIRHHITGVMREMRMKCDEMKESLRNLTHNHSEIRLKLQNSGDSNSLKDMSDNNRSIVLSNERLHNLEGVMKKMEQQIKDLQKFLSVVMINIDRIVRRSHNENGFS